MNLQELAVKPTLTKLTITEAIKQEQQREQQRLERLEQRAQQKAQRQKGLGE